MKRFLQWVVWGMLFIATCALAETPRQASLNAVNRAGELRMLSQRIIKAFAQIGLNVQSRAAESMLDESARRFEDNLKFLEALPTAPRPLVDEVRIRWRYFKPGLGATPSLGTAQRLDELGRPLLQATERLTRQLQYASGSEDGAWVNLAGRQRMLSQRLTKAYLLISWGDTSPTSRDELDMSLRDFSLTLEKLMARSDLSPDMVRERDVLARQWAWMKTAVATEGATHYRLIVVDASEEILAVADRLTRLFEAY